VATGRDDLGFLLALASRRWNETLERRFAAAGYGEVRASYGSLLVPLFEEDGLRLSELARRAHLSKQTLTTMARLLERDGLISRRPDPEDARATRVFLTERAKAFRAVAETVLAELDAEVAETIGSAEAAGLKASLATLLEAKQ
jgi:DNA-binding MarR family transcriptional regulator